MERENFDVKSTEKWISDDHSSCLASIQPPPTHILPLPTRITAPAQQQRLRIGRVSGLVMFVFYLFDIKLILRKKKDYFKPTKFQHFGRFNGKKKL